MLDGQWRAIVDPYQSGYLDYRYRPYADGGMGANKKPTSGGDLVEYDFDAAGQLAVPGDWNTQRPELLFYEGAVWYKRDFDYRRKAGRRQFVWFGAANYHAIVFLNGKKLGEHTGGFTPFQFEITSLLRDKGNFLIVMVDDERHAEGVPTLMTDWWNYGGLTRSVKLVDVAETFVEDYSVQLAQGSQSRIAGWVRVNGPGKQQRSPSDSRSRHFTEIRDRYGRLRQTDHGCASDAMVPGDSQAVRGRGRDGDGPGRRAHRLSLDRGVRPDPPAEWPPFASARDFCSCGSARSCRAGLFGGRCRDLAAMGQGPRLQFRPFAALSSR